MTLTPYDTGKRLEPKTWVTSTAGLTRDNVDDFGKVDFDNEESVTVFTVHAQREEEGYALKVDNHSGTPLRVVVTDEDGSEPLAVAPSAALQANVKKVIAGLPTETERIESEVYWQNGQALVLVGGETGYRKQQAIMVYANGLRPSSAIVKGWADGVRDTRIG